MTGSWSTWWIALMFFFYVLLGLIWRGIHGPFISLLEGGVFWAHGAEQMTTNTSMARSPSIGRGYMTAQATGQREQSYGVIGWFDVGRNRSRRNSSVSVGSTINDACHKGGDVDNSCLLSDATISIYRHSIFCYFPILDVVFGMPIRWFLLWMVLNYLSSSLKCPVFSMYSTMLSCHRSVLAARFKGLTLQLDCEVPDDRTSSPVYPGLGKWHGSGRASDWRWKNGLA